MCGEGWKKVRGGKSGYKIAGKLQEKSVKKIAEKVLTISTIKDILCRQS